MPKGKRKAPQKECPECKSLVHARVSFCRKCKHTFYIKKNVKRELLAKNWRDLEAGDVIKVITGSGPYYLSKDNPGEKLMMGPKGKFEVLEIVDNNPRSCGIYGRHMVRIRLTNDDKYVILGALQMRQDIKEMLDYLVKYIEMLKEKETEDE